MSIVEYYMSFNHNNPKCRYCKYYDFDKTYWLSGKCINEYFKGNKNRQHNSKACVNFRYRNIEEELNNRLNNE